MNDDERARVERGWADLEIVCGDPRPVFRQIEEGLRMKIASGELKPDTKLPSVRGLAMQLTVNPNTVAKAYARLKFDGLVESRERVGVFVCEPRQRLSDGERERKLEEALRQFVGAAVPLGFDTEQILARLAAELEQSRLTGERKSSEREIQQAMGSESGSPCSVVGRDLWALAGRAGMEPGADEV